MLGSIFSLRAHGGAFDHLRDPCHGLLVQGRVRRRVPEARLQVRERRLLLCGITAPNGPGSLSGGRVPSVSAIDVGAQSSGAIPLWQRWSRLAQLLSALVTFILRQPNFRTCSPRRRPDRVRATSPWAPSDDMDTTWRCAEPAPAPSEPSAHLSRSARAHYRAKPEQVTRAKDVARSGCHA